MLTYTFSKREKVLLVILAVLLIAILWYVFVFQNVNNTITQLDSQISSVQEQTTVAEAKATQMESMQKVIDERKAEGAHATTMPSYDNAQNVMVELNSILASTDSYNIEFDELDTSEAGYVKRGATISFGCSSYEAGEAVVLALQDGVYPCVIDSFGVTDNTATKTTSSSSIIGTSSSASSSSSAYSGTVHAVFYEKA